MSKEEIEEIEKLEEELSVTKQQKFNFGNLDDTSTLDKTFLDEISPRKRRKTPKLDDLIMEEDIIIKKQNGKKSNYNKNNTKKIATKIEVEPKSKNNKQKKSVLVFMIIICILVGFIIFHYLSFNHHKVKVITKEKIKEVKIIDDNYLFLGDSITEFYDLDEFYKDKPVVNSGIAGNTTKDILNDMEKRVYQYNPSKVFLLIGTNDIEKKVEKDEIEENIENIVNKIKENRPYAKIYVQSIYPVDEENEGSYDRTNKVIMYINEKLQKFCIKNKIAYINLYDKLLDEEQKNLSDDYTEDGLHLNDEGYKVITKELEKYLKK